MKFEDLFQTISTEEADLYSEPINAVINFYENGQVDIHSLMIIKNDTVICERYWNRLPEDIHNMYSITKSLTAIAIGMLEYEGKIHLSDHIVDYYPILCENRRSFDGETISKVTIEDMLSMRSCHARTTYKIDPSKNWVESFFVLEPTKEPGADFYYETSSSHVLAALVEKLTGKDMYEYLKEKMFPLEFSTDSYIARDPFDVEIGGGGLIATTKDLAMFGYFIEHKGNLQILGDRESTAIGRVISEEFIEKATSKHVDTSKQGKTKFARNGYGYYFWMGEENEYMCYGMNGQFIYFIPKKNLIVISTANTEGEDGNQILVDGFRRLGMSL